MKLRKHSLIDTVRDMMEVVLPICDEPRRPGRAPHGATPSQELIDCALEIARICFDAENNLSWSRRRESLNEQLQWSTEESVLHNLALLIEDFSKTSRMGPDDVALMDNASVAIDLVLAKYDGDIH